MKKLSLLLVLSLPLLAGVKIAKDGDKISIEIDGKPFTDFYVSGPDTPKPYLHPLRTASGLQVTRSYPMANVEGESKDHPHHRGLWFSHGEVNGLDFWANEPSQQGKKGKIVLSKVDKVSSGDKQGVVAATFNWNDPDNKTLLVEHRTMTFYSDPALRIIDFDINLDPKEKVTFGDTKEGTFAIRLAAGLEEPEKKSLPSPPRTGKMIAGDGRQGEKEIWGKRAEWVDYGGKLEGQQVGVAIFDHPGNPKHPTYWHSRSYGLFAANIFGEHDFYDDKARNGSVTIEPGHPLRFRYRVVIHPGDAASAHIADMYHKYASK